MVENMGSVENDNVDGLYEFMWNLWVRFLGFIVILYILNDLYNNWYV